MGSIRAWGALFRPVGSIRAWGALSPLAIRAFGALSPTAIRALGHPGLRCAYPGLYSGAPSGRSISILRIDNCSFIALLLTQYGLLVTRGCAALTPGCILAPFQGALFPSHASIIANCSFIALLLTRYGLLVTRGCAALTPGCILAPLQGALFPLAQFLASATGRCPFPLAIFLTSATGRCPFPLAILRYPCFGKHRQLILE